MAWFIKLFLDCKKEYKPTTQHYIICLLIYPIYTLAYPGYFRKHVASIKGIESLEIRRLRLINLEPDAHQVQVPIVLCPKF